MNLWLRWGSGGYGLLRSGLEVQAAAPDSPQASHAATARMAGHATGALAALAKLFPSKGDTTALFEVLARVGRAIGQQWPGS